MHAGLYVGEVVEHFRSPEDGGNGARRSASFLPMERRPSQLAGIAQRTEGC